MIRSLITRQLFVTVLTAQTSSFEVPGSNKRGYPRGASGTRLRCVQMVQKYLNRIDALW